MFCTKKPTYRLRKLAIGLVSLTLGLALPIQLSTGHHQGLIVFAQEMGIRHSESVPGSSNEWGTVKGTQHLRNYTDTSLTIGKTAHNALTEDYLAIRIPESYPMRISVNGQEKTLEDLKRDKLGQLIAEIDGRDVPLLDYGMVEYQLNRYLGKDIYNIYGSLSYSSYAFLTTSTYRHGYFELSEKDQVYDTSGQLITGFFQTPEYWNMPSSYHKNSVGWLSLKVGDANLSTNLISGRLTGLKSAKMKHTLVLASDFSMAAQNGQQQKGLADLAEDQVQALSLTPTSVAEGVEFTLQNKRYRTTGRINYWKNATINPLKSRLAVMSIGDGSNIHGFDLYSSNTNYIEVTEVVEKEPEKAKPEKMTKLIEFTTEDNHKVGDGTSITGHLGEEVPLSLTPPTGYEIIEELPKTIRLENEEPYRVKVRAITGEIVEEKTEEIDFQHIRQENSDLYEGDEVLVQKGEKGQRTLQVVYETVRGQKTEKQLSQKIIRQKEPTNQIIQYGTKKLESEEEETVTQDIPFTTEEVADSNLYEGERKVERPGQNGQMERLDTYRLIKGIREPKPIKTEEKLLHPAVNQIVRVGTKPIDGQTSEVLREELHYQTRIEEDDTLYEDQQVVVSKGQNGIIERTLVYRTVKGEKSEELISTSQIIRQPVVDEVIKIGTKPIKSTSRKEEVMDIPFETTYQEDTELEEGVEKIVQEGKVGRKKIIVTTHLLKGEPDGEPQVEEIIEEAPVNKVVVIGRKKQTQPSQTQPENKKDKGSGLKPAKQIGGQVEEKREVNEKVEQTRKEEEETMKNSKIPEKQNKVVKTLPETGSKGLSSLILISSTFVLSVLFAAILFIKGRQSHD